MPLPQILKLSLENSFSHLASLPDFSVDLFKSFVVLHLNAAVLDFTNIENLFFRETREIQMENLIPYDAKLWSQLSAVLKELEEEIKSEFCEVKLILNTTDRGYLYGQGKIGVTILLKFKKEQREAHAKSREDQKLRLFPDEVLTELAEKISSEPYLLDHLEQDPESEELGGGDAGIEPPTPGPGAH